MLPVAISVVLLGALVMICAASQELSQFKASDLWHVHIWTYNATFFWTDLFQKHSLHGPHLVALATQITQFTFSFIDVIKDVCMSPTGLCPGDGHCDKAALVNELTLRHQMFHRGVLEIAKLLADDMDMQRAIFGIVDSTAELVRIYPCEQLAEGLRSALDCVPLIVECLACTRGVSDVSRASMAVLHAVQIAAMSESEDDIRVARPSDWAFDVSYGLDRQEILAAFLLEALGARDSVGASDISLDRRHGPFDAQVLAAEVGSIDGSLSESLLKRVPDLKLLVIDPFESADKDDLSQEHADEMADAFWARMRPYRNRSTIVWQRSVDAAAWVAPDSLDLVFIDGDHSYDAIREKFGVWRPKLKIGGILAGHDYNLYFPGVIRAVHEFALSTAARMNLGPDHMWWFHL